MHVTIRDKAYTAGILDGEGSIQINPSKSQGKHKFWCLTVQISSNNKALMYWLKNLWKIGNVTIWKARGSKKNRKSYNWRLYSYKAKRLLEEIRPYLIIKKEHTKLALEFGKYVNIKGFRLSKTTIKKRNQITKKMRTLNLENGKGITRPFRKGIR